MNHKKALIDYRRQRAKETMLDARMLLLLYGSYSKGCTRRDSDIDVAVVVDLPDCTDKIEITANLMRQARSIDVNIEPLCILLSEYNNHEPASILGEIIKTSIEL
ncbi:MAG: nucleotidyltransferase domain-containing protein [Pseudomonadota bacterium]